MIADLKPYAEYRGSGSRLLGAVPTSWDVRPLRTLVQRRNERNHPDLPLLSVAREKGVFVRSLTDPDENHNVIPEDLSNYKVARAGSLVINKMKAWQGSMGIAPCDGIVSPAYFVFDLGIENRMFAQRLLRSKPYVGHFAQASDGVRVGQWDLSIPGMRQIPVLLPPKDEQDAIVRFLDWANGRLERAIRAKRKVIALLNEQKQAIIHRAVTRGLDPSVPLKPSGIPWLGDIPRHWEVLRLGGLVDLITGFPFASEGFDKNGNGTRLLRGVNVTPSGLRWKDVVYWVREPKDGLDGFAIYQGDIILGMDRPEIAGGIRVSVVQEEDVPALLLQRVARLRVKSRLDARLLLFLLRGRMFSEYMAPIFTGVSVPHLSPGQIRKFKIALPPLEEQQSIISSIAEQTLPLESAISRLEREIDLLREYRTRLVADVVTGKLDVREAAAKLPVEEQTIEPEELVEYDSEMIEDEITEPAG